MLYTSCPLYICKSTIIFSEKQVSPQPTSHLCAINIPHFYLHPLLLFSNINSYN